MTKIEHILNVVQPNSYAARYVTLADISLFEDDLKASDKYELQRTQFEDWRIALKATFESEGVKFCVTSNQHAGALAFGVTPFEDKVGRIWMLQSKSFAAGALQVHGNALPHKLARTTKKIIDLFLLDYETLFNFIPSNQSRNIRWLGQAGFEFFNRTDIHTDMFFFGCGSRVDVLATNGQLWSSCLRRK